LKQSDQKKQDTHNNEGEKEKEEDDIDPGGTNHKLVRGKRTQQKGKNAKGGNRYNHNDIKSSGEGGNGKESDAGLSSEKQRRRGTR